MLQTFFEEILGIAPELAGVDSCKLEHLVSPATSSRLRALIQFLHDDPDGRRLLERFRQARARGAAADESPGAGEPYLLESL